MCRFDLEVRWRGAVLSVALMMSVPAAALAAAPAIATAMPAAATPAAAASAPAAVPPGSTGYVLQPGDTIELSVAGLTELHSKTMIDIDGTIQLPLIQPVMAGGLTLDALRSEVQKLLPRKTFRQRAGDGREVIVVVSPDEIMLNVSEYRPVYVRGDVARPGEQPFRPGLTVRQVVALAGGYDVMRFRMENPFLEAADLRAQYETLWTNLARRQAHAAALTAMIDGTPMPDLSNIATGPLPKNVLADIARVEIRQARAQADDFAKERAFLEKSAATAQVNATALGKPLIDAEKSEHDEADYKSKLSDLLDKGVVPRTRVSDQQRSLLESTQRFLDYTQRIHELEQSSQEFTRRAQHSGDEMRVTFLRDLQDTNVEIANIKANLQAVGEKLMYTGAIRSQLVRGSGSKPDISIYHTGVGTADVRANEDTVLTAGDTVEVSLRAEMTPAGLSN